MLLVLVLLGHLKGRVKSLHNSFPPLAIGSVNSEVVARRLGSCVTRKHHKTNSISSHFLRRIQHVICIIVLHTVNNKAVPFEARFQSIWLFNTAGVLNHFYIRLSIMIGHTHIVVEREFSEDWIKNRVDFLIEVIEPKRYILNF